MPHEVGGISRCGAGTAVATGKVTLAWTFFGHACGTHNIATSGIAVIRQTAVFTSIGDAVCTSCPFSPATVYFTSHIIEIRVNRAGTDCVEIARRDGNADSLRRVRDVVCVHHMTPHHGATYLVAGKTTTGGGGTCEWYKEVCPGFGDSKWFPGPMIVVLSSCARKVTSLTRTALFEVAEPILERLNRSRCDFCGFQYRVISRSVCFVGRLGPFSPWPTIPSSLRIDLSRRKNNADTWFRACPRSPTCQSSTPRCTKIDGRKFDIAASGARRRPTRYFRGSSSHQSGW